MHQTTMTAAEASQAYWQKHTNPDGSFYLLGPYATNAAMTHSFLSDLQEHFDE